MYGIRGFARSVLAIVTATGLPASRSVGCPSFAHATLSFFLYLRQCAINKLYMHLPGISQCLFLAVFVLASSAWGQAVEPAFFDGGRQSKEAVEREAPSLGLSLPAPAAAALPPLDPDELERLQAQKRPAPVIGIHRSLPAEAVKTTAEGAWQATAAGRLWRLRVTSPDARALRIHFQDFDVGKGSVWLHAADGQVGGPYSGRGIYDDGDFWSDIVFGDSATIEYLPDPAVEPAEATPFRIAAVGHIRSVPGLVGGGGPPSPSSHTEPAPCHLDATCYSDWSENASAVALILFERDGNTYGCSGALLIDRQETFIPYFLTAAHCINTNTQARSVIAYWRYQTQTCDGIPPSLYSRPTTRGARLLATMDGGLCTDEDGEEKPCPDRGGDATLLRLGEDPPGGTWYLGWDAGSQSVGASVTGIHHPSYSFKRISFGRIVSPEYSYHEVSWSQGRTEPGSPGSPLFDGFEGNGRVIGIDSFGRREDEHEDICLTNPVDGYMRFSDFYPRIRRFLEGEAETAPTVSLTASPSSITRGGSATLRWSSTNAASGQDQSGHRYGCDLGLAARVPDRHDDLPHHRNQRRRTHRRGLGKSHRHRAAAEGEPDGVAHFDCERRERDLALVVHECGERQDQCGHRRGCDFGFAARVPDRYDDLPHHRNQHGRTHGRGLGKSHRHRPAAESRRLAHIRTT